MTVQNILEDQIFSSGWTEYDPNIQSNEMYQDRAGRVVGLWIKPAGFGWQWETFGTFDQILESGSAENEVDAKNAAEASARRILLASQQA